jgi:alpha/beta superfamily hydrolase
VLKERSSATKIERSLIAGPAGKLEALLEWDPQMIPRLVALACHPHPLYGGTMHNKVVFRAGKAAFEIGLPTLRFNFRGVGQSEGEFAGGVGEREDTWAALDYLEQRFSGAQVCVMGFSFGAWVGLATGAADARVRALVGLGLPTATLDFNFLRNVQKPKLIVQGTEDQFSRRAQIEDLYASLPEPKRLHWIDDVDHFFTGKLDEVQQAVGVFLRDILAKMPI